jgi:TGS domain
LHLTESIIVNIVQLGLVGFIVNFVCFYFFNFETNSAHLEWNLDGLLDKIWEYLDLVRIYTKPKGMNPDYEDPVILSSKRRTVEDFCNRIHKQGRMHSAPSWILKNSAFR